MWDERESPGRLRSIPGVPIPICGGGIPGPGRLIPAIYRGSCTYNVTFITSETI